MNTKLSLILTDIDAFHTSELYVAKTKKHKQDIL